jgi:hypothetical protein
VGSALRVIHDRRKGGSFMPPETAIVVGGIVAILLP